MKKVLSLLMALVMAFSAVQCLPVVSFAEDGYNYEAEPNNERTRANFIFNNEVYTGSLDNRNDVDWYEFTIDDDVDYFNVIFEANEHNEAYVWDGWNVSIYQDGSDSPLKAEKGNTGYQYVSPNLPYTGGFYIKVEANDPSQGEAPIDAMYDVQVETHSGDAWENEPNDAVSQAMVISSNKTYSGVTTNRNDVDLYQFKIDKDSCYFNVIFEANEQNNRVLVTHLNGIIFDSYGRRHSYFLPQLLTKSQKNLLLRNGTGEKFRESLYLSAFHSLFNRYSTSNSRANHRVVAP